jgi:uncharacterized protein YbjT (DUF2867 family)
MRIAVTGGTGFIGGHLARRLAVDGQELVLIARQPPREKNAKDKLEAAFVPNDLSDASSLAEAFTGCDAVAHCAGINRQLGKQNFHSVHVEGTKNVVAAAQKKGVRKVLLMSFLRARPNSGSAYHQSKWEAEEIVRKSGLDYTIVRAGMVYGRGDHMLDHLSHALYTFPLFALVGFKELSIRPLAINDLIEILRAVLVDSRLSRKTIALTGPEKLYLSEAVRRVARVTGRKPLIVRLPVSVHYLMAWFFEHIMAVPLVARAQVRILSEEVVESALDCDPLPSDLLPAHSFTENLISEGLPEPGPFRLKDLRCCS